MSRKRRKGSPGSPPRRGTNQPGPPSSSAVPPAEARKPSSVRPHIENKTKRLLFKIAASVLVPLVLVGGLETVLRLAGFGHPTHFFLRGEINGDKIIYDNQQFGWRFFPPAVARTPRPVVFSQNKPPQTCRIFVFGESAAYGDPSPAFGLPRLLEVLLRRRYPNVNFEVINAAMTAINSNVILPIARDCADQHADVWVIYMGNNEVVGPFGGGTVFGPQVPSRPFIRASMSVNASRIGQLLAAFRASLTGRERRQSSNVSLELFLSYKLRHDDPPMEKVYAHFASNLEDILQTGRKSGAMLVVSTVASNLKDCAPFASLHRPNLGEAERNEWERLYQAGLKAEQAGDLSQALNAYRDAARIDDRWAELQFHQARLMWDSADFAGALHHYTLARDYDVLRFRADSRINDILRQTSSNRVEQGIAFVDGNEVLAQHSPHKIPGEELLYEHVHLNFTGNYWLARAIAEQITGTLKPAALAGRSPANRDWSTEQECALELGLNDWDRYQTLSVLRRRLEGAPFTLQLNHGEQYQNLQKQMVALRSSLADQKMTVSIQRCEQALSSSPDDWVLHQKLAQLLGQSPDKSLQARALAEWQKVVALVPHYPDGHYELGELLHRAGQATAAEDQLRLALKLRRDYYPGALNALGRVLADENRLTEAIAKYKNALALKPNFAEASANLGVALNRLGRKSEAKAHLQEAMRVTPGNTNAAANLAQLLDEHGEVSAAVVPYTEMLRADPDNATAHYDLARCLGMLGRSSEAQEHFAAALRLQPDFADAHTQLAMELVKSGKETEALDHFRQAVRLQPESAVTHKNLGVALARRHNFDEAAKEFAEALRLDPGDVTAQKYLEAARPSQTNRN